MQMVQAVREGRSMRAVAREFSVSVSTVKLWVDRAAGQRVDRVDFSDHKAGALRPHNRSSTQMERRVLVLRKRLREHDVLGEYGAPAIARVMAASTSAQPLPSIATIGRILKRHGQTDGRARVRRPAPPKGWYLPAVAAGEAELDSFDLIEDLKLAGGPLVQVLNALSLHGHLADSWPALSMGAREVVQRVLERWMALGLPRYAQFDNDTRFQGAHQFPDTVGRVSRLCLALGVIPVFAPPLQHGFQNAIEGFNGLWQAKLWQRVRFADLPALQERSARYIDAHRARNAARLDSAPPRQRMPKGFHFDLTRTLRGTLIFLRRADPKGCVSVLGHRLSIHPLWQHRLVRCEVCFDEHRIRCFGLRRREPTDQPLLAQFEYIHHNKPFKGEP